MSQNEIEGKIGIELKTKKEKENPLKTPRIESEC